MLGPDQQRALAKVVESQRGQDDEQPGPGDRLAAEVTHVGIERLSAGDGEHDGGQREERNLEVPHHECQCIGRRERLEDFRVAGDAVYSARADRDEPRDHDRAEEPSDGGGAVPLNVEQRDDDDHGDRHDPVLEVRVDDLDAFDGRQHGDRGGDHAVTEKQCGAEDSEHSQHQCGATATMLRAPSSQQGDEGHDAALAVVVGTHHEGDVGERDDEHDRPEDQRHDAVDVVGVERNGVRIAGVEHRLDGVDRAGSDVAEHDPERGEDDACPDRLSGVR